jgi:Sec-independent protein secretion pathway component TatC
VAVVAVLLPGIDPVTTTLEMIPLIALYELSIWLAVLVERRASRPEVASLTDP